MDYTSDQIEKLKSLGINIENQETNITSPFLQGEIPCDSKERGLESDKLRSNRNSVFPLLSISGLTLLSFSGLVLLKGKSQNVSSAQITPSPIRSPQDVGGPTQVPKSIQHYLLTSQQLFSQAVQLQNENRPVKGGGTEGDGGFETKTIELLNQSILAATQAIKDFPQDYRGYQQRGKIYQSLTSSQPNLINQSISDLASAQKLNPNSSEITHTLASLYAQKGDAQNTIYYLNQTVTLDPTQAQNFYDLAKIQQQTGLLSQALDTYTKLTSLLTDPNQKTQVESEKLALEKLISQNPNSSQNIPQTPPSVPSINPTNLDSPTIQANAGGGLIVAAPDDNKNIAVTNQSDSNSLSGNATLVSGQPSITISNTNLSSTSQVYITITKGGKNQNLQVLSKDNQSFTVGLDSAISENIEFKWWIIK